MSQHNAENQPPPSYSKRCLIETAISSVFVSSSLLVHSAKIKLGKLYIFQPRSDITVHEDSVNVKGEKSSDPSKVSEQTNWFAHEWMPQLNHSFIHSAKRIYVQYNTHVDK